MQGTKSLDRHVAVCISAVSAAASDRAEQCSQLGFGNFGSVPQHYSRYDGCKEMSKFVLGEESARLVQSRIPFWQR